MTELASLWADPDALLCQLLDSGRASERKCVLLGIGHVRSKESLAGRKLSDIELLERYAEGEPNLEQLHVIFGYRWSGWRALEDAMLNQSAGLTTEESREARFMFDCVFGDICRPLPQLSPSLYVWNNGAILSMAQAVYDERAFDRLPILSDALEEAGCDNADILAHLRSPGPHTRGCWPVDLILAKE